MTDRIGAVLICDDIRQEVNGKQILIGVYGGYIIVQQMPFTMPLSIWIELIPDSVGARSLHVRLSYTTGFVANIKVDITVREIAPLPVAIPALPVSGASDGELVVETSFDGTNWQEITRKPIRRGKVPGVIQSVAMPPTH